MNSVPLYYIDLKIDMKLFHFLVRVIAAFFSTYYAFSHVIIDIVASILSQVFDILVLMPGQKTSVYLSSTIFFIVRNRCEIRFLFLLSEKYPQIKKLFGVDTTFKWKVIGLVLVQFAMLYLLRDMSWPIVVVTAYLFGGVINHALMLGKNIRDRCF